MKGSRRAVCFAAGIFLVATLALVLAHQSSATGGFEHFTLVGNLTKTSVQLIDQPAMTGTFRRECVYFKPYLSGGWAVRVIAKQLEDGIIHDVDVGLYQSPDRQELTIFGSRKPVPSMITVYYKVTYIQCPNQAPACLIEFSEESKPI